MELLDTLFKKAHISKINDLEMNRYLGFFENSWRDNLKHCEKNINDFPRWSLISGYYVMHDITKLLIAKKLRIKIDFNVHKTTVIILKEILSNEYLAKVLEKSYKEFLSLVSDLEEAKKERIKIQYYTGTDFLKGQYKKRAAEFHKEVIDYVAKIKLLVEIC
jgi:hypothetical protein